MAFTMLAVLVGVAFGRVRGGRLTNIVAHRFDAWPIAVAGLALLVVAELVTDPTVSMVAGMGAASALVAACLAHARFPGLAVIAIGVALNGAVVAANGTMPVRPSALVAAGVAATPADVDAVPLGPGRSLEDGDTIARTLGRALPVTPLRTVISFGDLIVCIGLVDAVSYLVRDPARLVRRRRPPRDAKTLLVPELHGWDDPALRSLGDAA